MTFLNSLSWRLAEKNFDPAKKVADQDLAQILEAIKMAPTSFGLQPFHAYIVGNPEVKTKLKAVGYNQPQFEEASHIIVLASRKDVLNRIDQYIEQASNGKEEIKQKMAPYADMMRGSLSKLTDEQAIGWAKKQAYIALGFALAACAELHIDSCPMEGFSPTDFDQILNLPADQNSCLALAIGYRKEDATHYPKFRFADSDLFTTV